MRYPTTTVNTIPTCSQPIASARALADLRLRLAPLTPDAGRAEWLARATAHTLPTGIELPAGLTAGAVRRLLTATERAGGLPREYALGLRRRAGRDVRWSGMPTTADVLDGMAFTPTGGDHDSGLHARHTARRALAEAAVARLAVLAPYVDDGRLGRLTWTRDQIVEEAAKRADAAEKHARADGSAWETDYTTRERDPAWHRRQLRGEIGRTDGHVSWILGLTGGRRADGLPSYCSRWTLARARQTAAASKEWAAASIHVRRGENGRPVRGADGDYVTVSTSDLIAGSRRARRARLYALCKATEELGTRLGWTLAFATLTLPPAFHPFPSTGGDAYDTDTTPLDARAALQARWHRTLAAMHKSDLRFLGGQGREMHRDGAPHIHFCAYVHPDDYAAWVECLTSQWPETPEHAHLPVEDGIACQIRSWHDQGAASVATYLYGYASKSLDESEGDNEDGDAAAHAAACRRDGIRRWSWVGFRRGLAGDWQRVARERAAPKSTAVEIVDGVVREREAACPVVGAVWEPIRDRRYADALEGLGALSPQAPTVRRDYTTVTNRYGETVREPHALYRADATDDDLCSGAAVPLLFRPHRWGRLDRATWSAEQATWTMLDDVRAEAAADADAMTADRYARIAHVGLVGDAPESLPVAVRESDPRSKARKQTRVLPEEESGGGIPPHDPPDAADWAALEQIEAAWTKIAA